MSHDLTRLILQQRLDATAGTDRLAHQAESDGAGSAEVTKLRIEGRFENRPDLRLGQRQLMETPEHIAGMFAGQPRLSESVVSFLLQNGVDSNVLHDRVPMRAGYVLFGDDGRFEFVSQTTSPWGSEPVHAALILIRDRSNTAIDIVAWEVKKRHIGTWLGRAWALGQDRVFKPRLSDGLPVHRSPLDWLRLRGDGIVILNHRHACSYLAAAGPLIAEDEKHRAELKQALTRPAPRILVASQAKEA
jgi:hypothetical protein